MVEYFYRTNKTVTKVKHSEILSKKADTYKLRKDFDNMRYFCLVQD